MGLTFVTPLILAGAALVAVPIVLHLIMRRQPKHLLFPALRFIQQREEANRRKLQLRHLLLLLMRCLAILLLALALARPSLKSAGMLGDQEAPIAAALVFDTSVRMEYKHENKTRLEVAQETAAWLLPQLPADSELAVIESSSLANTFAVDLGAARQRIERLATVAAPQPFLELLESALQLVNDSTKERKEVYVFTDLARASWSAEAAERFRTRLEKYRDVAIYVIDVGVIDPRNFALGDLKLSAQAIAKRSPVTLETVLQRAGAGEERSVALYLIDDTGLRQKRSEQSFGWLQGQSLPAEFNFGGLEIGTHQGYLQIVGDDALSADDTRYFTVEVRPAWRVLIAAPQPIDSSALFLAEALSPEAFRRSGQARFDVVVVPFEKLSEQSLDGYAAVCLLDPAPLEPAVWEKLHDYVKQGGGLAMFLGRRAAKLQEFNDRAALEVLPGKLLRQARSSSELFLAPPDLQHPVLGGFRSRGGQIPWSAFQVARYWQFEELDDGVNTIVPFNNGKAALVEQTIGRGRVLTMTTPISESASDNAAWNMIATGFEPWPFLVLANEMLFYLVGNSEERFNYLAGDSVILQIPEERRAMIFTLRSPDGVQIPQTIDPTTGTLTVSATNLPGNYQLRAGGTDGGVQRGFSANVAATTTQLDRATPADLDQILGEKKYRLARNRDEITRDVSLGRIGMELYPLLILLVALVLGVEHLLANRFYRRDTSVAMEAKRSLATPDGPIHAGERGSVGGDSDPDRKIDPERRTTGTIVAPPLPSEKSSTGMKPPPLPMGK